MTTADEFSIAEQAARWMSVLERGGDREHAEFAVWLKASPQHVRQFLLLTALEREAGEMDLSGFDVDDVLARGAENVVTLASPSLTLPRFARKGKGKMRKIWVAAAAVIAGICVWWQIQGPGAWQSYSTLVGEQRTFEIEDGSVVELTPLSRIAVRIDGSGRYIRMLAGEAVFKVRKEASRPFQVHAGDTTIRAVGTEFAVNRRTDSLTVSVLEGRVQVSNDNRVLSAGDEVKITANARTLHRRIADAGQPVVARRRSLTFSGDTLAEIAEDFNRYNRAPKIRIEGDALRNKKFSGVFDADDPQSLVDYLTGTDEVSIDNSGDLVTIRSR